MNLETEKWIREHPAHALDTMSRRLDRAVPAIRDVRDHLLEQLEAVSVVRAQTLTAGHSNGEPSNPPLAIIQQTDALTRMLGDILDGICTMWVCVDMLDTDCRRALGMRAPATLVTDDDPDPQAPRCIGDDTAEGASCWNIPSPRRLADGTPVEDGRCHECGPRHDAMRRAASDARRLRRHMQTLGET